MLLDVLYNTIVPLDTQLIHIASRIPLGEYPPAFSRGFQPSLILRKGLLLAKIMQLAWAPGEKATVL